MKLVFESLEAHNLYDTGSVWDKQDPCVKLTLGTIVLGKTPRQKDAGTQAAWPQEVFYAKIERDRQKYLDKHGGLPLMVDVYNEDFMGTLKSIGHGVLDLLTVFTENEWQSGTVKTVSVNLTHTDIIASVLKGNVDMKITMLSEDVSGLQTTSTTELDQKEQSASHNQRSNNAHKHKDTDMLGVPGSALAATIATLTEQKATQKQAIKNWLDQFKKEHGREANAADKSSIDGLYESYRKTTDLLDDAQAQAKKEALAAASATQATLLERALKVPEAGQAEQVISGDQIATKVLPSPEVQAQMTPALQRTERSDAAAREVATAPAKAVPPVLFDDLPTPLPVVETQAVMHTAPGAMQSLSRDPLSTSPTTQLAFFKYKSQDVADEGRPEFSATKPTSPTFVIPPSPTLPNLEKDLENALFGHLSEITLHDLSPKNLELLGFGSLKPHKFRQLAIKNASKYGKTTTRKSQLKGREKMIEGAESEHVLPGRFDKSILHHPVLSPAVAAAKHMVPGSLNDLSYNVRVKDAIPRQRRAIKEERRTKEQKAAAAAEKKMLQQLEHMDLAQMSSLDKWKHRLSRLQLEQDAAEKRLASRPAFALRNAGPPAPGRAAQRALSPDSDSDLGSYSQQRQLISHKKITEANLSNSFEVHDTFSPHYDFAFASGVQDSAAEAKWDASDSLPGASEAIPIRDRVSGQNTPTAVRPTGPTSPIPSQLSPRKSFLKSKALFNVDTLGVSGKSGPAEIKQRDTKRSVVRIKLDQLHVSGLNYDNNPNISLMLRVSVIGKDIIGTTGKASVQFIPGKNNDNSSQRIVFNFVEELSANISEYEIENGAAIKLEIFEPSAVNTGQAHSNSSGQKIIGAGTCSVKDAFHLNKKRTCLVHLERSITPTPSYTGLASEILQAPVAAAHAIAHATEALVHAGERAAHAFSSRASHMASGAANALASATAFLGKAVHVGSSPLTAMMRKYSTTPQPLITQSNSSESGNNLTMHTEHLDTGSGAAVTATDTTNVLPKEESFPENSAAPISVRDAPADMPPISELSRSASSDPASNPLSRTESFGVSASFKSKSFAQILFRAYAKVEKEVFVGDPAEDGDAALAGKLESVQLGTDSTAESTEPAWVKLRRTQHFMLLNKAKSIADVVKRHQEYTAAARESKEFGEDGGGRIVDDDVEENATAAVQQLMEQAAAVAVATEVPPHEADQHTLELFNLLMTNQPEGLNAPKNLDVSETGPLSRHFKNYRRPWREKPPKHIPDPNKARVGSYVLSLKPLLRDLVYSPSKSVMSLGSVSGGILIPRDSEGHAASAPRGALEHVGRGYGAVGQDSDLLARDNRMYSANTFDDTSSGFFTPHLGDIQHVGQLYNHCVHTEPTEAVSMEMSQLSASVLSALPSVTEVEEGTVEGDVD